MKVAVARPANLADVRPPLATSRLLLHAGAAFAAYLVVYVLTAGADSRVNTLVYLVMPAVAVAASAAAWRAASRGATRWALLSLAMGAMFLGELAWAYYDEILPLDAPPIPSVGDVGFFAGYAFLLALVAFSVAPGTGVSVFTKVRFLLDIALLSVVGTTLALMYVLIPAIRAESATVAETVTMAAYPIVDIVLISSFAALVLGLRGVRLRPWQTAIALGILATAIADLGWSWIEIAASYQPGTAAGIALDVTWLCGYFAFGMAAVFGLREARAGRSKPDHHPPLRARGTTWWEYAVPVAALAVLPIPVLTAIRSGGGLAPGNDSLVTLSFVSAALVVTRSAVLSSENRELAARSISDPLTGLFNHRFFHERLATELARCRRSGESLSLAVLDLDNFARVNNTYGHPLGDECLRHIGQRLSRCIRASDLACRVGGDEFGLIMPDTGVERARDVCRRLAEEIRDVRAGDISQSVSIGIAAFPIHGLRPEELVSRADGALYWAKRAGRDRTVVYDAEVVQDMSAEQHARRIEEQAYLNVVQVLAAAVDARDSNTQFHSRNVAALAKRLAARAGFDERHTELLESAALLHDVGKIGIPDKILRKPRALSPDERARVRQHPELGQRILCAAPFVEILPWIMHHHERWDGGGYPAGLAGDEIPIEARMLAVCDAFDAMVSDRPYRDSLPESGAVEELLRASGAQFDPAVVREFVESLRPESTSAHADSEPEARRERTA